MNLTIPMMKYYLMIFLLGWVTVQATGPAQSVLLSDISVPLLLEGKAVGVMKLPAGSDVEVVSNNGTTAVIRRGGAEYKINASALPAPTAPLIPNPTPSATPTATPVAVATPTPKASPSATPIFDRSSFKAAEMPETKNSNVPSAQIAESSIYNIIHVDCTAKEDGIGSPEKPYKTLKAGFDKANDWMKRGIGVKLAIHPGTYREYLGEIIKVDKGRNNDPYRNAPFVMEGTGPGVVISGSIINQDGQDFRPETWKPVEGHPGVFEHAWNQKWGAHEPISVLHDKTAWPRQGVELRREMVFIDKLPLNIRELEAYRWEIPADFDHVKNLGQLVYKGISPKGIDVLDKAWTFTVSDRDDSPEEIRNRIFIRLPNGMDMKDALIEVPFAKEGVGAILRIVGKNNFVIRNITFMHANGQLASPLSMDYCKNVLIEGSHFDWNNHRGLYIGQGQLTTIKHCSLDHNGGGLFSRGKWLRVEDSSMSFNKDCMKVCNQEDSIFLKLVSVGSGGGLHLDEFCKRVVFDKCFSYGIKDFGIVLELSEQKGGDYIVQNCVVANNKGGIAVTNAAQSRIIGSIIVNNHSGQIWIENAIRGGWATNEPDDWKFIEIKDNIIGTKYNDQLISYWKDMTFRAPNAVDKVIPILSISGNQYFKKEGVIPFKTPEHKSMSFEDWKKNLAAVHAPGKQDSDSIWKDPGDLTPKLGHIKTEVLKGFVG